MRPYLLQWQQAYSLPLVLPAALTESDILRKAPARKSYLAFQMGIAFLSSGFLAFVVLLLQGAVEDAANAEQEAARAEQAISLTSSISGFNPKDLPPDVELREINFTGKTLLAAQLPGAYLDRKDFQSAILTRANLEDAHLSEANLVAVDLTDAELTGADLSGADLSRARFAHTTIEAAKSLRGARVNEETCWPRAFLAESPHAVGLVSADGTVSTASTAENGKFGHTCAQEATLIIRTTVTSDADGLYVAVPPAEGGRVKDIEWLPTASGPSAHVTWIVEPPSVRTGASGG